MQQPDEVLPVQQGRGEPGTLILADKSLERGFVQLPKLVLFARNLSRDAKILYAVLLGYAWQEDRCFPGYRRLCQDLQASENMLRKYMRELEAARLLSQKRRGLGKTNIYTLNDLRTAKIEVLDPNESEVLEPAKTEGEIEPEGNRTRETYQSTSRHMHTTETKTESTPESRSRGEPAPTSPPKVKPVPPVDSLFIHELRDRQRAARGQQPATTSSRDRASSAGLTDIGSALTRYKDKLPPKPPSVPSTGDEPDGAHPRPREPRRRASDKRGTEEWAALQHYAEKWQALFYDQSSLPRTMGRLWKAYERSGLPFGEFLYRCEQAETKTQLYSASITTEVKTAGSPWPQKNKMPYFCSVIEELCGLRSEEQGSVSPPGP